MEKDIKKSNEKEKQEKKEGKNYNVVHPGNDQKTLLLTTDGKNVNLQSNNISNLEMEMMLMKALQYIRSQN